MSDPRRALDAIGQLPDVEIDVADAALHLARVDAPDANWEAARAHLSELAREAVQLPGETLAERAESLINLLSSRYGYSGDTEHYDDLANANLIRVIERRRGLPVALGVIWLHAARAAGWAAHGVDFPAHFLVALKGKTTQAVLDVFHGGQPMDAPELRELLKRIEGDTAELRPGLLRPMGTRAVLLRLQNNIVSRRLQSGNLHGALTAIEDMLRIAPDQAELWRQAGLLNQRLDQVAAALQDFQRFLDLSPDSQAAARVRSAMDELRTRLN
ncbi:MAG: transglutaminase family protein [Rhodospirillales bacterium]|nr:transglutaminase family protein [Rhodospirillales bacterium]